MVSARAAVLRSTDTPFSFEEVTVGAPEPDELLVRIVATGLCHTDLAVVHGHLPSPFPVVLGHEGAGVVEAVGDAVRDFAVGDHVALSFAACGHCANCRAGRPAYCLDFMAQNFGGAREDGSLTLSSESGEIHGSFFGQSSFASYALVAARNAVKVPESADLNLVGPLGCGIQTGAGTVLNALRLPAGSSIVVSGAGAVGLSAVMAAKAAGAATIIAVDVLKERLETALELGATHAVDGSTEDTVARILELTDGTGAEYAVDTTAVPAVVSSILTATRFGATVALLGVGKPDAALPLGLTSGKTILGVVEGDAVPQSFIPRLLAMQAAGEFPFERLIATYPFEDLDKAIADTQSGAAVKAVLTM
jgi:aryl-alcohol dehydrogenase